MTRTIWVVLGCGGLVSLLFMLREGEPGRAGWWLLFLPFAVWVLLPYLAVARAARRLATSRPAQTPLLATAVLLTGTSGFLMYQAFVAQPDAQSGLVFVFLPLWQLLALVPLLWGAHRLARSRASQRRTL